MKTRKSVVFAIRDLVNSLIFILPNLQFSRASPKPPPSERSTQDSLYFLGSNFLNLAYHASIVVDNTLYIDAGEVNWQVQGQPQQVVPMNQTLAIDLSQSWDPANIAIQSFQKDSPPTLVFESLWAGADGKSFYAFGGSPSHALGDVLSVPATSFWQFSDGTWQSVNEGANAFPSITRPAMGLAASGGGVGYMLGGFDSLIQDLSEGYIPHPGILSYNMTSNLWNNASALGFSYDGTAFSGSMQFLPNFGSEGLLVAMGGETSNNLFWKDEGQIIL